MLEQEQRQSQKREQEEDLIQNEEAEAQALEVVAQHASESGAIPELEVSAQELVTKKAGARALSASVQALGQVTPVAGELEKLAGQAAEPAAKKAKADQKSSKKEVPGPWTSESIAKLVAAKSASGVIQAIGGRDTQKGVALLKASGAWDRVLETLPRGDGLAAATRASLFAFVKQRAVNLNDAKRLFEIRFKHPLAETSGRWTLAQIELVWKQLDALPAREVSQNAIISAFVAISGGVGVKTEKRADDTFEVQISESGTAEQLSHAIRQQLGDVHPYSEHIEAPKQKEAE